jgi:hypothetical protein
MTGAEGDEILQADERLRAALRHAPDAQHQAPPELTACILASAREQALAPNARPAPARAKRPQWLGVGTLGLAPRGLVLGLAALLGVAAFWWLQRPGDRAGQPVALERMAQAPRAEPFAPPVVVAQAEVAALPVPEPTAAPTKARAAPKTVPAAPAQPATETLPEIVALAPPPPAEFRPAPPAAKAPAAAVAAASAPDLLSAQADRQQLSNPPRDWLAAVSAIAPAQRVWLLALAEASEGRWREEAPPLPASAARADLTASLRQRASAAGEDWQHLEAGERRASLRQLPQGLLWCEAGRCRLAPLSAAELRRLQDLLPGPQHGP